MLLPDALAIPDYGLIDGYVIGVIDPTDPAMQADITRFSMMTVYEDTGIVFEDLSSEDQADLMSSLQRQLREGREEFTYFGVFKQSTIAGLGYVSVLRHSHEMSTLRGIAVDKAHRRNGVGSALVRYGEAVLTTLRKEWVIGSASTQSIPFYQKLGYELVPDLYPGIKNPIVKHIGA